MRRASCMSFGMIVTRFAWIAHRFVSSNRPTRYASDASCCFPRVSSDARGGRKERGEHRVLVTGTKVGDESERSYLQCADRRGLESEVSFEVLSDFSHQPLERQLADQQFSRLLVSTDFSQSHSSRPVPMRLFDSSGRWCRLSGRFCGQLFSRSLSSRRLAGRLFGSSHGSGVMGTAGDGDV